MDPDQTETETDALKEHSAQVTIDSTDPDQTDKHNNEGDLAGSPPCERQKGILGAGGYVSLRREELR
eukprot:2171626-Rhodomonas_salina.1